MRVRLGGLYASPFADAARNGDVRAEIMIMRSKLQGERELSHIRRLGKTTLAYVDLCKYPLL